LKTAFSISTPTQPHTKGHYQLSQSIREPRPAYSVSTDAMDTPQATSRLHPPPPSQPCSLLHNPAHFTWQARMHAGGPICRQHSTTNNQANPTKTHFGYRRLVEQWRASFTRLPRTCYPRKRHSAAGNSPRSTRFQVFIAVQPGQRGRRCKLPARVCGEIDCFSGEGWSHQDEDPGYPRALT
jgi:hypothetical protein